MENETITNTPNNFLKVQNKKWNNLLDDYDNYIKEYILHYKKSLQGNNASATIYPYMKVKSEELSQKICDAYHKSCLTKKQIKRLKKIHLKIATTCY